MLYIRKVRHTLEMALHICSMGILLALEVRRRYRVMSAGDMVET